LKETFRDTSVTPAALCRASCGRKDSSCGRSGMQEWLSQRTVRLIKPLVWLEIMRPPLIGPIHYIERSGEADGDRGRSPSRASVSGDSDHEISSGIVALRCSMNSRSAWSTPDFNGGGSYAASSALTRLLAR
jgi:hypothetical protein